MPVFHRGRIASNLFARGLKRGIVASLAFALVCVAAPGYAGLTITPTFTSNFVTDFGANATAAENAWKAAANVFETHFSDNIHVNITVDAVSGTGVFGQSYMSLYSTTFSNLQSLLAADATTADDSTAVHSGGSAYGADPTSGAGTWWVTRAEAKAIGFIADDTSNDGITKFGAGYNFTFSGPIASGTYDFRGVAAHEISEVLGRLGISGGTLGGHSNSYSLIDLFSYTGAGARGLGGGAGNNFSIDNGSTLLKEYNNAASNGLDSRDWAPGTNDAFNQFSNSGVVNSVSQVDLRELDVIGYNFVSNSSPPPPPPPPGVPEPTTLSLWGLGAMAVLLGRRRRKAAL